MKKVKDTPTIPRPVTITISVYSLKHLTRILAADIRKSKREYVKGTAKREAYFADPANAGKSDRAAYEIWYNEKLLAFLEQELTIQEEHAGIQLPEQ